MPSGPGASATPGCHSRKTSGWRGATTTGSAVTAPRPRSASARGRASYSPRIGQQKPTVAPARPGNERSRCASMRRRKPSSVAGSRRSRAAISRSRSAARQVLSSSEVITPSCYIYPPCRPFDTATARSTPGDSDGRAGGASRVPGRGPRAAGPHDPFAVLAQGHLPARADLQRLRRARQDPLRGAEPPGAGLGRARDHPGGRRRGPHPGGARQRHRHEPGGGGREPRHHRALGHPRVPAGHPRGQGGGRPGADRAVRGRLLRELHGRRSHHGRHAARGHRGDDALGVDRRRQLHARRGRAPGGRDHRHAPPQAPGRGRRAPRLHAGVGAQGHRQALLRLRDVSHSPAGRDAQLDEGDLGAGARTRSPRTSTASSTSTSATTGTTRSST